MDTISDGINVGAQPDEGSSHSRVVGKQINRKIICRYGRGCTHMHDPVHKERFWHPHAPALTEEQLRTHYICNECGFASPSLQDLQLHLQRKTAWSNSSLIGCRISCLIDSKEWHEGFVTQFHRSGKHYVEFRQIGEKRWLNMKKMAFYIVERPLLHNQQSSSEYKDNEQCPDMDGLAPIEDNWVYVDDLSLDYAFAQSVLFKIFGSVVQETGHKTRGHMCLTEDDREGAGQVKGSLLYGELLPRGANKAFGPKRLATQDATVLFDLGMGTGKIAMQAFLQFRNLQYVYGVELSMGRYCLAEEAALRMVDLLGKETFKVQIVTGRMIVITEILGGEQDHGRVLHLEYGNMFDVQNIEMADIVMLETDIPSHLQPDLCGLLSLMKDGARTLTYLDLRRIWTTGVGPYPYRQMDCNRHLSDRFPTSWSVQRGHHFYLWTKVKPEIADPKIETTPHPDDSGSAVGSGSPTSTGSATTGRRMSRTYGPGEDFSRDEDDDDDDDDDDSTMQPSPRPKGCLPSSLRSLFGLGSRGKKHKRHGSSDHDHDRVIPVNADGSKAAAAPAAPQMIVGDSPRNRLGADGTSIESLRRVPKPRKPDSKKTGPDKGTGSPEQISAMALNGAVAAGVAAANVAGLDGLLSPRAVPRSSSSSGVTAANGVGGAGSSFAGQPQHTYASLPAQTLSFSPVRQFHESENMHTPEIIRGGGSSGRGGVHAIGAAPVDAPQVAFSPRTPGKSGSHPGQEQSHGHSPLTVSSLQVSASDSVIYSRDESVGNAPVKQQQPHQSPLQLRKQQQQQNNIHKAEKRESGGGCSIS